MNEREYKEIVTPIDGHKLKIKAWLTGRERREIRSVLLSGVSFSATDDAENPVPDYKFDGKSLDIMQDKSIENIVVEVNGKTENVLNDILDMKEKDYEFVIKEIDKVTSGINPEEEKK